MGIDTKIIARGAEYEAKTDECRLMDRLPSNFLLLHSTPTEAKRQADRQIGNQKDKHKI